MVVVVVSDRGSVDGGRGLQISEYSSSRTSNEGNESAKGYSTTGNLGFGRTKVGQQRGWVCWWSRRLGGGLRSIFERKVRKEGNEIRIEGGWRRRSRSRCVGVVWFVVCELWVAVRVLCGFGSKRTGVQAYGRVGSCERRTRVYFGSKQVCVLSRCFEWFRWVWSGLE